MPVDKTSKGKRLMKMKVLFTQKKEGKVENPEVIGQKIARAYKVKGDKVPPAYPCESEILVLLCFENYGKIDPKLVKFCQDLFYIWKHFQRGGKRNQISWIR